MSSAEAAPADANRAVGAPRRLEAERWVETARPGTEPVVEVDRHAVAGVGGAIAAVIGAQRPGAGLMVGASVVPSGARFQGW